ncbi:unnamed protein product [Spirodela intermedia]|uniref:Protein kinase domain-containing protein n=1 Tax=Spirodela intermedia TaxID=51605 RepID=A0A7I8JNK1_SPIIN|nr:unnamed protein product [Spirodela intermedia]CAA6671670.1 unnamed protein product [Spirodela intermedia]
MRSGTLSLLRCLPSLLITLSSYSLAIAEFTPDYHPLQAFRSAADPSGAALYSWTPRTDPCSDRHLQGTVDDTLTFLPYLRLLNLSHNRLTGELPDGFLRLRRLRRIDLSVNNISGHIPSEIARLPRLLTLRLERNLLTGEIRLLWDLSVTSAGNLSSGGAPTRLREGILSRRSTQIGGKVAGSGRRRGRPLRRVQAFHGGRSHEGLSRDAGSGGSWDDVPGSDGGGLGKGSGGETITEGEEGQGGQRRYGGDGEAADGDRGLRHPNVTSLRAYYHSDDELLLVYDYLPNGSLHSLLHGNRGPGRIPLYWTARLKLALGQRKLAHQKLTSSNILVDDDGNACVVDFALLHLLAAPPPPPSSTSRKTLTHESDVYDFGILLLEILTGKPAAEGEVDLQKMVREDWSSELFDVELVACKEAEDEMVGLLQVALLCVAPSPAHRPTMSIGEQENEGLPFSPSSSINDSYYLGSSTPVVSEDTASG